MNKEKQYSTFGRHVALDMWVLKADIYYPTFKTKFIQFIEDCGMTVLKEVEHHWENKAFTLSLILEESSADCHFFPEYNYISFNIYTCGEAQPMLVTKALGEWLRPEYEQINQTVRGVRNDTIEKDSHILYPDSN